MRRLTPVLFTVAWPGPDYAEGLYIGKDGDAYVVWAEIPDGSGGRCRLFARYHQWPMRICRNNFGVNMSE